MAMLLDALKLARDNTTITTVKNAQGVETDKIGLSDHAQAELGKLMGNNPMVAFTVLCVASAGQGQKKMEHYYTKYEATTKTYKDVNLYAKQACEGQQTAADTKSATTMTQEMVTFCDARKVGYSKKGNDILHNKDEWQNVRDGLNHEKSIASTEMKEAGATFDQAAKDCDSAQQLAVDGVKKHCDIFGKLAQI